MRQVSLVDYGQNIVRALNGVRNKARILNDEDLVLRARVAVRSRLEAAAEKGYLRI